MVNNVCYNGNIYKDTEPIFNAQNRAFKYGDGIFETIKVFNSKILLEAFHFKRLQQSLNLLHISAGVCLDPDKLSSAILHLCTLNNCLNLARVRLEVYRSEGNMADYVIEAVPLSYENNTLNKEGYSIDIDNSVIKSMDIYANLKTANYLPYILAGIHAKNKNLHDNLVLNSANNICDASKANLFLIKDNDIFTPSLDQGCINGVMRQFLLEELKRLQYNIYEKPLEVKDLIHADEAFLTNAIYGIRWIGRFRETIFRASQTTDIFHKIFATIYY